MKKEIKKWGHFLIYLYTIGLYFETSGVTPYLPLERLQVQGTSTLSPPFRLETAEQHQTWKKVRMLELNLP